MKVNTKSLDLNLLEVLDVLLEERQVTRAAVRLGMSQPAVSRALARLRESFEDPLLVKSPGGYDLTRRAEQLQPQIKTVLAELAKAISPPLFEPNRSEELLRIACLDLEGTLFLPQLLKTLRDEAPGMRLKIHSRPGDHFRMLEAGEVDFVISGLNPDRAEAQIRRVALLKTEAVCVMDSNHPLAKRTLDLASYLDASHGIVSMTGVGNSFIDRLLERQSFRRQITLRLDSFLTIPNYCIGSDLIFALPRVLAERLSAVSPLAVKALPEELEAPDIRFYLYWHQRDHSNPMNLWIRRLLQSNAKQFDPQNRDDNSIR